MVLALGLLQGCSAVKLAYNNLPELAYWWLDGYADLDGTQSSRVRDDLARLQQWHRGAELPKIAELLRATRELAAADTTPEQACRLFEDIRLRLDAVVAQAEPASVALAMDLSAAQITHIEARFAKGNAEWREKWAEGDASGRLERRLKSARERSEDFYGTLQERQLETLRAALVQSDFDPERAFTERMRRQQDLLRTLRYVTSAPAGGSRPTTQQATAAVRAYLERAVRSPDPGYRAWADRALQDGCRTVALLHNSTTAEQRERAVRRVGAYERAVRELAAQR